MKPTLWEWISKHRSYIPTDELQPIVEDLEGLCREMEQSADNSDDGTHGATLCSAVALAERRWAKRLRALLGEGKK